MTKETQPYTMRMSVDLRVRLEALAMDERRSLANYIEGVLSAHVEAKNRQERKR